MQTEDRQFKSPPAAGDPLKLPAAMEQDFSLPENADCFISIDMKSFTPAWNVLPAAWIH